MLQFVKFHEVKQYNEQRCMFSCYESILMIAENTRCRLRYDTQRLSARE